MPPTLFPVQFQLCRLSSDGVAIEMRDSEDDVYRAAEELGIDLSRREPSSVEEV